MPVPITIPRLGWNMDEGVFNGWLKQDGEAVRPGDRIFTLEGEKATEEIESLDPGILHIPADGPKPGDRLPVGAVIGHLLKPGEAAPGRLQEPAAAMAVKAPPRTEVTAAFPKAVTAKASETSKPLAISPRARRAARELGIDWSTLKGSGRTGRVRERDIRAAAAAQPSTESGAKATSSIRRTIAERMWTASRTTAPVTLTTTADATNLVNLRKQFQAVANAASEVLPGYTDLLVKLTAKALQAHPMLNACWEEDRIRNCTDIHIGVAVDTEAGLVAPVVRDVSSLSLKEVAARAHDLAERARQRKLSADEMRGGTFTVTSLGAFGIDAFTPIINLPQCAILGVGRIVRRPAVCEDQVTIRDEITLSLTFDHRAIDGAPAARFLQTLVSLIENPGPSLIA